MRIRIHQIKEIDIPSELEKVIQQSVGFGRNTTVESVRTQISRVSGGSERRQRLAASLESLCAKYGDNFIFHDQINPDISGMTEEEM